MMKKILEWVTRHPSLASCILVTATVLGFYSNSFTTDWHYDDFHHIKENINIRKVDNIPMFFRDASTFSRNPNTAMYRPLLMATLAVNYQMGIWSARDGYYVLWYHVFNFAFHLVSVLVIYFILLFLFRRRIVVEGIDPAIPSLFGALLFGINTINTETVVYVSSRSSGLTTLFVLASFYLYLRATEGGAKVRYGLLVLSAAAFMLGMLTKEEAITLALILVLYEVLVNRAWMEGRSPAMAASLLAVRLAPHAAAAAAFLGIRQAILRDNLATRIFQKGGTPAAPDLVSQLSTQTRAWVYYIREWFLPTSLSIDKPFEISRGFDEPKVIASLALILVILAAVLAVRRRHPAVAFGTLWWFIALLPTTVIRLNVPINDHRLYLPGFGLILAFSYVVARLYVRFRADSALHLRVFVATCAAVLVLMGLGTFKRNMAFATEETIWQDVILKDPRSVRGYNNLGIYYEQTGDLDRSIRYYNKTIVLAPMFPNPYINLGNVFHKKKEYDKAEKYMKRALVLEPNSALASYNLGNILREAGKIDEAISTYLKALEYNPRYIEAANNLANIHFSRLQYQQAIVYYRKALDIDPTFAMSYYNIGLAYENLGNVQGALDAYSQFLRYWLGDAKFSQIAARKVEDFRKRLNQ